MIAQWDTSGASERGIRVIYIDYFDARGMRRVYGRGDWFGHGRKFNMDVWLSKEGLLLSRFWARRDEVDWLSFEVIGSTQPQLPPGRIKLPISEDWVPQILREEYDNWILSES